KILSSHIVISSTYSENFLLLYVYFYLFLQLCYCCQIYFLYPNNMIILYISSVLNRSVFMGNDNTLELLELEKTKEYGQDTFEAAESLKGADKLLKIAVANLNRISSNGFEELVRKHKLDALVTPYDFGMSSYASTLLAFRGHPGITVPAGYDTEGVPFGICFGGLKGTEPKLIEIAYGFEQATKIRKPPSFKP
ncbi:hypothetical protein P3X46_034960, partial [Hevea brasiliensis]